MNKFTGLTLALIGIFYATTVLSKEVTIAFEGNIDFVQVITFDPLNGDVGIGTTFSGTYTYDTELSDIDPTETDAVYQSHDYPNGISLNIAGHSGDSRTASLSLHYRIKLTTKTVQDIQTVDTDFEGFNASMQIFLEDPMGTALSSHDLLETAPVLSDYNTRFFGLRFGGNDSCCGTDVIFNGVITNMYVIPPPPTSVNIDIKPGSDPNSINLKSKGVIPVAILSTNTADGDALDFDATQVDPHTVMFGPNGASIKHGNGHVKDVDGDGDPDMVLHFKTQETGIQCGDTDASLTGSTFANPDSVDVEGADAIKTVGCPKQAIYAVGDTGPAGGIVFYVTNGGLHGLEASLEDQAVPYNPGAEWGCVGTDLAGADGTVINTGQQNTADILAGCTTPGIAARLVDDYSLNGFDDWFLPSKDELNLMFLNIGPGSTLGNVGGFTLSTYWSSSELNTHQVWHQTVNAGGPQPADGQVKDATQGVRAIRAF